MANLREKCHEVIMPFVRAYGELCDDLGLSASKHLYLDIAQRFVDSIPEETAKLPYSLKGKRIQKLLDAAHNEATKSSKDAAALALQRMILLCKKHDLIDGRVMIKKRMRPEELAIQDMSAFALLDDFIEIRQWLCARVQVVPRRKKDLPELIVAALIAVNGICTTNAHLRISSCQRHHVNMSGSYPTLDVPTCRYYSKEPPTIRYPLLPNMVQLLGCLKSEGHWLFPDNINPKAWNQRKMRTVALNKWLAKLWETVFGKDIRVPRQWTIRTFIACSRLYMVLNSSPIVVGFLSGRAAFASLDVMDSKIEENVDDAGSDIVDESPTTESSDETAILLAKELITAVRSHMGSYHHKDQSLRTKRNAALHLLGIAAVYYELLNQFPCLRHLINWLVWELENDGSRRKMGTLQGLWNFIPTSLLDELGNEDSVGLDSNQWMKLAEYLIQENTYSPATRSKIKQHLKSFHEYLCAQYTGMSRLDWRRGELRVYKDQGGGTFPLLSEFDLLYELAAQERNATLRMQLQAALTLAFFGGLRAEEICLLSKMDIDEITIQVRVWWSKTKRGRRRLPLAFLTPEVYRRPIDDLQKKCPTSQSLLFSNHDGSQILPDTLAKRIKQLITRALPKERQMSIHTLRHGFASWILIRYFALHEPELLKTEFPDGNLLIPDADHDVFSKGEQKKLVRVFNGRVAGEKYAGDASSFFPKPEHFAHISRLIGHATRDTTARTYVHSMEWIAYYYLCKLRSEAIS